MFAAELFSRLIGRALPRAQGVHERLPNLQALPILSSDALSSVAYATEASLGVLILAGSSALKQSLPITLAIIALIVIVVLSYLQAISAYPNGGGSYVVARENLGRNVSLVAAAALLIDYTLTAAVSLMAGTQALSSLVPSLLQPFCDFVVEQEQNHLELCTTVVMPVVVPRDRLDQTLLNQRALNLFSALSAGKSRVFSIVRYYMSPAGKAGHDALAAWSDVVVEPDHA